MAHMVETIAYSGEKPWHGLGVEVDRFRDLDHLIEAAGLDWTVSKRPLVAALEADVDGRPTKFTEYVAGKFGLLRSSDHTILDVVGSGYKVTQNKQALEFLMEFVKDGGARLETAGSLDNGRYVWGLVNLEGDYDLTGGSRVESRLLVAIPHKLGVSIQTRFTDTYVVCNNTLSAALRGRTSGQFKMSHASIFDRGAFEDAKRALGIAHEQVETTREMYRKLAATPVSDSLSRDILSDIFDPKKNEDAAAAVAAVKQEAEVSKSVARIMNALHYAPGWDMTASLGTAWGLLNAATFVASHGGRSSDKKMQSLWLGTAAKQNDKLVQRLVALAD